MSEPCDHDFPVRDGRCVGCHAGVEGEALEMDHLRAEIGKRNEAVKFVLWFAETAPIFSTTSSHLSQTRDFIRRAARRARQVNSGGKDQSVSEQLGRVGTCGLMREAAKALKRKP